VTPVDVRADVYGLGALLFLLLTGEFPPDLAHPPGKGRAGKPESGAAAAINAHTGVPKLLRAVCARALAPEPDDRYPSVEALAADIGRYRAGQAVTAYRENLRDRATRFGRTYRTAILLVLAYVIMRAVVALTTGR
jgi:serine/threonine protein kinase